MTTVHYSAEQIAAIDWYTEAERIGAGVAALDDARQKKLVGGYLVSKPGHGPGLRYIWSTNDVPHDPEGFEYAVRRVGGLAVSDGDLSPTTGIRFHLVLSDQMQGTRPAQMKPRSIGGKATLRVLNAEQVRQILIDKFGDPDAEEAGATPTDDLASVDDQAVLLRMLLAEMKAMRGDVDRIIKAIVFDRSGQGALPGVKP